jgi:hypothetical protein
VLRHAPASTYTPRRGSRSNYQDAQDRIRELEALTAGMVDDNEAVESPVSDATTSTGTSLMWTQNTLPVQRGHACGVRLGAAEGILLECEMTLTADVS